MSSARKEIVASGSTLCLLHMSVFPIDTVKYSRWILLNPSLPCLICNLCVVGFLYELVNFFFIPVDEAVQ